MTILTTKNKYGNELKTIMIKIQTKIYGKINYLTKY